MSAVRILSYAGFAWASFVAGAMPFARSQDGELSPRFRPFAAAVAEKARGNLEASVPAACYTRTDGRWNPCWTCHTKSHPPNHRNDSDLQKQYSFSAFALTNRWTNLFSDLGAAADRISDESCVSYVQQDNLTGLRESLLAAARYPGYVPDIELHGGFDAHGFARDGSGWRALRFKPFPGTFWPTNGSTNDVMIRLPVRFRLDSNGEESLDVYRANLSILEAAIARPAPISEDVPQPHREVEPLSETQLGCDIDGDGKTHGVATWIARSPERYLGGAAPIAVVPGQYPAGTEFLHTVRYLDPGRPDFKSLRLKELRYMRKEVALSDPEVRIQYAAEAREKERGELPSYPGSAVAGLRNRFGWRVQGFIEDEHGWLRLQTREEHEYCMGCHGSLGVTVDSTFSFARKIPGSEGWQPQDLRGQRDVRQLGHEHGEIWTYFDRAGAGDEFRANRELSERFRTESGWDDSALRRAEPGGDLDLAAMLYPTRARALRLNKVYWAIVQRQSFRAGRETYADPPRQVRESVAPESTGLLEAGRTYDDGRLWLDWPSRSATSTSPR